MNFKGILRRMRQLKDNGDPEIAHGTADQLLIDALHWAAENGITEEQATELETAYNEVDKWYA